MTLLEFKWFSVVAIFALTLLTGLLSIGFTNRFRKQLEIGDAIANGIFIGATAFHLIPEAIQSFERSDSTIAYLNTAFLLIASYFVLWLIEKVFLRKEAIIRNQVHVGILVIILSIHAIIAGLTLGISNSLSIVSILFFAIVAHKGFETFAFVINVYRQIGRGWVLLLILFAFSFITPLGIVLGMMSHKLLETHLDAVLTACFSAVAAGTFLYIGTAHSHHLHNHRTDSYQQYTLIIATMVGVGVMGILGIWI